MGHWARECKNPSAKDQWNGAFSSASGTKNYASETPLVEHFIVIAAVDLCPFVWDRLRAKREAQAAVSPTNFGPSDVSGQEQLAARPRVTPSYVSGDLVAYWRAQKVQQGQVQLGGRWYGTAVVFGSVG